MKKQPEKNRAACEMNLYGKLWDVMRHMATTSPMATERGIINYMGLPDADKAEDYVVAWWNKKEESNDDD